ncbi:NTP transferase domain-containing protein, partial [Nocardioides sp. GCM10027113]
MSVHGLLLAAGAGTRMGGPKALVHDTDGSWLRRAAAVLRDGGCDDVTVVLGAGAGRARDLLADEQAGVVVAEDWAEGMGASLRAGLAALAGGDADAAVVTLVDLPDLTAEVLARLLATGADRATLARAAYDGVPGHPVVLGRDHWGGVRD